MTTAEQKAVLDELAARGDDLVDRAVDWCAISSGSRNLDGLNAQALVLEKAFAALGYVERLALTPTRDVAADGSLRDQDHGAALIVRVRPQASTQVVLTGHYDTVYPADTVFRAVVQRADGALNGPGIADMKGGLSVMLGALEAFETFSDKEALGYTVVLSPDEEIGSAASAPLLAAAAGGAHVGMTYEPAMAGGVLASARKGSGNFHAVFHGKAAHAGRDFASGRNAITAAARYAATLDALNGQRPGVTINVARIDGGGPLNIVPDMAVVRFNVRLPEAADREWVLFEVQAALSAAETNGVTAQLHGGFTRPPKPFDPAQQALFEAVRETGARLGQQISWTPSGGVCEGNNLHAAGLPNVDTLGVVGGDIHSVEEHAWPDSFAARAQLSCLLLMRLATGEIDGRAIRALRRDVAQAAV
jgi:glutamate carboxypeptidase